SFLSAANNGKQAVSGLADELSNRIGQFYPADVKHLDIGAHSSIDDALIWLRRQPDDAHRTFWSRVINRILRWGRMSSRDPRAARSACMPMRADRQFVKSGAATAFVRSG